jgi:type II secretory pathway component PulJ
MSKYQRGFTLYELLVLIWALIFISVPIAVIYIAIHFIAKSW